MTDASPSPVVVIGGGPAGLTAAYELVKHDIRPLVLEKSAMVGGISRTEIYKGYRFDIGGHRFFTKVPEVNALWQEVLHDELIKVRRLSRIHYDGKFFDYPLNLGDTLHKLGMLESLRVLMSYLRAQTKSGAKEDTFEEWIVKRFGDRLYRTFFKTYTEKVWGIPCSEIRADWAAQRIKGLSLSTAVMHALFGRGESKSLIKEFDYPVYGPGQMWERFQEKIVQGGGTVRLNTETVRLNHNGFRVDSIEIEDITGSETIITKNVINSMPVTELITRLSPGVPDEIQEASKGLKYRDFLVVSLILNRDDIFPDNWIYIHSPAVRVGRIQNFKNWSPALVPDAGRTCLGMEYFCTEGDDLWAMDDTDLIELSSQELEKIGLAHRSDVFDGTVIRQPKAYPVYDGEYKARLATVRRFLSTLENLQTVGRNGLHRYNNQDHSMLTAIYAVRNLLGEKHDLWEVNTEQEYHEEDRGKNSELVGSVGATVP